MDNTKKILIGSLLTVSIFGLTILGIWFFTREKDEETTNPLQVEIQENEEQTNGESEEDDDENPTKELDQNTFTTEKIVSKSMVNSKYYVTLEICKEYDAVGGTVVCVNSQENRYEVSQDAQIYLTECDPKFQTFNLTVEEFISYDTTNPMCYSEGGNGYQITTIGDIVTEISYGT